MMLRAVLLFFSVLFLVLPGTGFAERVMVNKNVANIRSGPGTGYDILWKVEKYYPLSIIKKQAQWYYFRDFEGDEGWIHKALTSKTKTVIIKKSKCNVRLGPGSKYKVVFMVDKGIPFKVLKSKGAWINIQHSDGDKGWIHKSLVW